MFFEITVAILSIAFLAFIILSIPALLQVRCAAKNMDQTLRILNASLPAILKNLEETTVRLNQTARTVDERAKMLSGVFGHFQALLGIGSGYRTDSQDQYGFSFVKILKMAPGIWTGVTIISKMLSFFIKKKNN